MLYLYSLIFHELIIFSRYSTNFPKTTNFTIRDKTGLKVIISSLADLGPGLQPAERVEEEEEAK